MAQVLRAAWWVACITCAGCGYRVVQAQMPFGLNSIALTPFDEEVPVGLAFDITRAWSALLRAEGIHITTHTSQAKGTLRGVIKATRTTTSPITSGDRAQVSAYRINLDVEAELVDHNEVRLWSTRVSIGEDFLPPNQSLVSSERVPLAIEANRTRAMQRVAERIAQMLHRRLVFASMDKK